MAAVGFMVFGVHELFQARSELWEELKRLDAAHPVLALPNGTSSSGGLAVIPYLQYQEKLKEWEQDAHTALPALCSRNSTVASVVNSPLFDNGMRIKLVLESKRRGGRYADARALLWLLSATLDGLEAHLISSVKGMTPREPTPDDWERARQALEVLREVRAHGIDIVPTCTSTPWFLMPADWPERLSEQLKKQQKSSRPYKDVNYLERKACERFVRSMFFYFDGEVAVIFAKQFGSMIGWESDRLPACVNRWVAKLKST